MFNSFFKQSRKYLITAIILAALAIFSAYQFYLFQVNTIKQQELNQYQFYLSNTIDYLIKEKKQATQALAIALSEPIDFKQALLNRDDSVRLKLKKFSLALKKFSAYESVWIQLVDKNGVSVGRSWTDKRGDNLKRIRKDIDEMIKHPRRMDNFSVGKFALTFKSIVPLFDDQGQLLGMVDVISQVNSIGKGLNDKEGVRSVVLVDKSYRQQLTQAYTKKFVGDYYVANMGATNEDMALIERYNPQKFFDKSGLATFEHYLLTSKPLTDIYGQPMAVWVTVKPIAEFSFTGISSLTQTVWIVTAFFVLSIILVMLSIYYKRQSEFEKQFFFEVFENSTEIIFITTYKRIIQANRQFFDFFSGIENLAEFRKNYDCICNFFIEEKGYLSEYINGQFWHEYVLNNSDKAHYAKILYRGEISIFQIKAAKIENPFENGQFVSVLMTNITDEIRYKEQLEHLIIHDELTGIFNRHHFNEVLIEEIHRARRYKSCLSLLSFDIDHFKQINDEYGHDVGDQVLINISDTVAHSLRETDCFCRVGGEEFCVIMPETDIHQATTIAERIRTAVSNIPHSQVPREITISIGAVEMNQWDNEQSLYKRVDIALYQAKDKGRNCVVTLEE